MRFEDKAEKDDGKAVWNFIFFKVITLFIGPIACRILLPWPGIEPPQWKHGVLTIGSPGKSPVCNVIYFFKKFYLSGGTILVATGRIFGRGIWDLVPWQGIEPKSPALGGWNLSH